MRRKYLALEQYHCNHSATTITVTITTITVTITTITHRKLLPLLRRRKKTLIERKQLFASAEKVWSLSSTRRKSSSSQNRKHSHSHTHTLTHSHTGRLLYPRYSPEAARVMTTKVLSSRPRIKCGETNNTCLYITDCIVLGVLSGCNGIHFMLY